MAAGDIKGAEAMVKVLTAAATIVKGQVVCPAAAGGWEPAKADSTGKFGVAIDDAAADATFRAVVYGRVEATAAAALGACDLVVAAAGGTVDAVGLDPAGKVIGTTMGPAVKDGTVTVFVGLVA